ncbi:MAG: tetratricopeptide repeat protein [Bacteroidota bacterium]
MKNLRTVLLLLALGFGLHLSWAQSPGIGRENPAMYRDNAQEIFAIDNYFFIREANSLQSYVDFEGSFLAFERAIAQYPQSADVLVQRALFLQRFGMSVEAQKDILRANTLNPYAADLYGFHGPGGIMRLIEFEPGQSVVGLNANQRLGYYYELIDEQYQENALQEAELDQLEQIIVAYEESQLSEAKLLVEDLLDQYPQSALGHDLLGLILHQEDNYAAAGQAFDRAIELAPNFAIAHYNLSRLDMDRGNREKARVHLDRAIELQANLTKAYFDRALLRKQNSDDEGALQDYNRIIDLAGENYLEAFLNRGLTRSMLGAFQGAINDLNTAIEAFPNEADLYKNRGNAFLLSQQLPEAIQDFSRAIQLDENFAEAYYNRGLAHLMRLDLAAGCSDLNRAWELGLERAGEKMRFFCQ